MRKITNNDPIVRFALEEVGRQDVTWREVGRRSGIHMTVIRRWGWLTNPTLPNITAVLDVLGYELKIVRKSK